VNPSSPFKPLQAPSSPFKAPSSPFKMGFWDDFLILMA